MNKTWRQEIEVLSDPWKTWLVPTKLLGPANDSYVLYIPRVLEDIAQSFEFCTVVFGLVKKIHPPLKSLIISSDSVYDLVLSGSILLTDVKATNAHQL